jgi:hypothetical protein
VLNIIELLLTDTWNYRPRQTLLSIHIFHFFIQIHLDFFTSICSVHYKITQINVKLGFLPFKALSDVVKVQRNPLKLQAFADRQRLEIENVTKRRIRNY